MGSASQAAVTAALDRAIEEDGRFESCRSFRESGTLVNEVLSSATLGELPAAASALAGYLRQLVSDGENAERLSADVGVWSKGCTIDSFSYESVTVFFSDPRPYSGPDQRFYMTVLRRYYVE
jgi:hypothetical protein